MDPLGTVDPHENFRSYLSDARRAVRDKWESSAAWLYEYDGLNPPPEALVGRAGGNTNTGAATSESGSEMEEPNNDEAATTAKRDLVAKLSSASSTANDVASATGSSHPMEGIPMQTDTAPSSGKKGKRNPAFLNALTRTFLVLVPQATRVST